MMGKYFCNRFEVRMHHLSKVVGVTAITVALTTLSGCQTLKNSKLFGGKDEVVATKAEKSEQGYYQAASDNIKKGNLAKVVAGENVGTTVNN